MIDVSHLEEHVRDMRLKDTESVFVLFSVRTYTIYTYRLNSHCRIVNSIYSYAMAAMVYTLNIPHFEMCREALACAHGPDTR